MKKITSLFICCCVSLAGIAQNVGIGTPTPNASALLELQSTNKGLLLPRVADTTAITSPAKGLLIFSNGSKSLWLYNGSYWQSANGSAAADIVWQVNGDTAAITSRKYISINAEANLTTLVEGLSVDGSLLIEQKIKCTKTPPAAGQTQTMSNSSETYNWGSADSTGRIYDPGGANNNYNNNVQGNIFINRDMNVSFNPADFGIGAGDTLWISKRDFPACRQDYIRMFTNTNTPPPAFNISINAYFIFRSNGDNINGKGFDITFKKLYFTTVNADPITSAGISLLFDVNKGFFRTGLASNGAIGVYSTAMGFSNTASGNYSTAMGAQAVAIGNNSAAIGGYTRAMGDGATAIGFSTKANGTNSIAMGTNTEANGNASTSMGTYTVANGYNTTALGNYTNAKSFASLAIGSYNDTLPGTSETTWIATDPIFYIGNSINSSQRSNAMVVYKNANLDINGYTRLGKLSEGAPVIKMKELTLTSAATSTGQSFINHGLNPSKIISVTTLMEWSTGYFAPPEYSPDPLLRYNYFVSPTQIVIQNNAASCAYICSKTVKVLITYKE